MAKIKKILVPTDFSENSLSVFKFVKETAQNYGAKVDLIYILTQASPFFQFTKDPLGNVFEDKGQYTKIREQFVERLDQVMEEYVEEEHRGQAYVVNEDKPSLAIANFAESNGHDLIMIASRGWGDTIFKRGSVTEKLIRISSVPVLSVNIGYDPDIKNILVPTDGSQTSIEVLPLAIKIANKNNAKIDLLNVYEFESFAARTIGGDPGKYTISEMKSFVLHALSRYIKENGDKLKFVVKPDLDSDRLLLENSEGEKAQIHIQALKSFSAQEAIIQYALDHSQLVIIATRGRGPVSHLFIGSTTEKVARHLRMPVITMRPNRKLNN